MLPARLDAAQRARCQALIDGVDWKECMPWGWEDCVIEALGSTKAYKRPDLEAKEWRPKPKKVLA